MEENKGGWEGRNQHMRDLRDSREGCGFCSRVAGSHWSRQGAGVGLVLEAEHMRVSRMDESKGSFSASFQALPHPGSPPPHLPPLPGLWSSLQPLNQESN